MSIQLSSRERFIRDLARARELQGLTLEEIAASTKIARSTLVDFELATLMENPVFNRVYLRSIARTYAQHVGIPVDAMMQALDQVLADTYINRLSADYEGELDLATGPSAPEAEVAVTEVAADLHGLATEAAVARDADMHAEVVEPGGKAWLAGAAPKRHRFGARPVTWAGMLFLCAAAAAILVWWLLDNGDSREGSASVPVSIEPVERDSVSLPEEVRFGALIHATVVAESIVERMHLRIDDNLRRPYWIERDSARVFRFADSISIDNRLDRVRLYIDRYEVVLDTVDVGVPFVLTRGLLKSMAREGRLVATEVPSASDTIRAIQ